MRYTRTLLKVLGFVWVTLVLPFALISAQVIEQLPRKGFPQNLYDTTLGFLFLPGWPIFLTCSVLALLLLATIVTAILAHRSKQDETPTPTTPGPITTNTILNNQGAASQTGETGTATASVAERTIRYLLAARNCLEELVREVQDIALDASSIDLSDLDAVLQLHKRIERYLYKDRIRLQFTDAVGGLQGSLKALRDRTESIEDWPRSQENKKAAVEDATKLLSEIVSILDNLQGPIGSGLCCNELYALSEKLTEPPPIRSDIDAMVKQIHTCLTDYGYIDTRRRIVKLSEQFMDAFPDVKVTPPVPEV